MKPVKTALLIVIILGINASAECQKQASTAKLKSIIVTEEKYDMLVKKQYKDSETYFDARGNVIETINYKQGKVDKHFKYEYDADNNKVLEEEYDQAGKLKESTTYKYVNGLRTEKNVFDSNKKQKSKKTYTYTMY